MSYCREEGKDKLIVMSPADLEKPSTVKLNATMPDDPRVSLRLHMKDEQVCPSCVASMSFGPCGHEWLTFYRAWKGSDSEQFSAAGQAVSTCLEKYPKHYPDYHRAMESQMEPGAAASTEKMIPGQDK